MLEPCQFGRSAHFWLESSCCQKGLRHQGGSAEGHSRLEAQVDRSNNMSFDASSEGKPAIRP